MLFDAANAAKTEQLGVIRRDVGSDLRLSGVGKRGAKVGVRYDLAGSDRVTVKATGPLHFVAHPMGAHQIPKKRGKRARRRYAVIPGVGVRAWARHPGTSGKDTWNRGAKRARPKMTKAIDQKTSKIIKRGFG